MSRKYNVIWHNTIDSTNSEAQRGLADLENLSVIAAHYQTAGRGQKGNHWSSDASKNLTFSIVLKYGDNILPELRALDQFHVSHLTVLALLHYLSDNGIDALIKWPNDIYVGDNKICGILIEHTVRGDRLSTTTIGIGLNLNQNDFPPQVPNPTSMGLETGHTFVPQAELRNFLDHFDPFLDLLFTEEGRECLRKAYGGKIYRLGESTQFIRKATGEHFCGTIRAVENDGRLVIENEAAAIEKFAFKEVEYVIKKRF